jgi:hypothetical protein
MIYKPGFLTQFLSDTLFQEWNVMLFQPLEKELVGYLNSEYLTFQANRLDRLKPCLEALRTYIFLDGMETTVPYHLAVSCHNRMGSFGNWKIPIPSACAEGVSVNWEDKGFKTW